MIAEAIEKIIALKRPESIEIEGATYRLSDYIPAKTSYPDMIKTHTLSSMVDYVENEIDGWTKPFIHVDDHKMVSMCSETQGEFNQRVYLVEANAMVTDFRFKYKYDIESFIIALNSQFKPTDDQEYLLKLVSSIVKDDSVGLADDGISQQATVKSGVTFREEVKIKSLVSLQPFRTFTEVEQPESQFLFRIDRKNLECSLHPCDGSAWKLVAIERIKAFFKEKLPNIPVIA